MSSETCFLSLAFITLSILCPVTRHSPNRSHTLRTKNTFLVMKQTTLKYLKCVCPHRNTSLNQPLSLSPRDLQHLGGPSIFQLLSL